MVLNSNNNNNTEKEVMVNIEESEDYDTIGGFLSHALGKIPQNGETFNQENVDFTVLEADERKIVKIKIEKPYYLTIITTYSCCFICLMPHQTGWNIETLP